MAKKSSSRRAKKKGAKRAPAMTTTTTMTTKTVAAKRARKAKGARSKATSKSRKTGPSKAGQTLSLSPGMIVFQSARGELTVGSPADFRSSKRGGPPTPSGQCPSVDCRLAFQTLTDGLWVGVKGDCRSPCECSLYTLEGARPQWKRKGPGAWVKFSAIQGAAAVCDH